MMRQKLLVFLYTLGLLGVVGAVQGADEAWKNAWVKKVVTGAELKDKSVRECVVQMPADQVDAHWFAVLVYAKGRGWGYKTVPLPDGNAIKAGESVSFDFNHCDAPLRKLSVPQPHG